MRQRDELTRQLRRLLRPNRPPRRSASPAPAPPPPASASPAPPPPPPSSAPPSSSSSSTASPPISPLAPPSSFAVPTAIPIATSDALLQERLRSLEAELAEVRSRVNGLLFLVAGASLTQLLLRLVG